MKWSGRVLGALGIGWVPAAGTDPIPLRAHARRWSETAGASVRSRSSSWLSRLHGSDVNRDPDIDPENASPKAENDMNSTASASLVMQNQGGSARAGALP